MNYTVPDNPRDLGLPYDSWRPEQKDVIQRIVNSGKKYIALLLPTGNGKSVIAAAVMKITNKSGIVLTKTKNLQDQYDIDFDFFKSAKGMSNFQCIIDSKGSLVNQAPCQFGFFCPERHKCPYFVQKFKAETAMSAVTNYDMALMTDEQSGLVTRRGWLVCDEAQFLDDKLTEHSSIKLSEEQLKLCSSSPNKDFVHEDWRNWAADMYKEIYPEFIKRNKEADIIMEALNMDKDLIVAAQSIPDEFKLTMTKFKFYTDLLETLGEIRNIKDDWIIYFDETNKSERASFRPLWISDQAQRLFDRVERVILMSATLPDKATLSRLFAISESDIEYIEAPHQFPLYNRPLVLYNYFPMNKSNWKQGLKSQSVFMNKIIAENPDKKILIHTYTNAMRDELMHLLKPKARLMSHKSYNREASITLFTKTKEPKVMLSPSMDSGVNVPDLTIQIIPRLMWPSLGDPWVKKRKDEWPLWYIQQVISKMVQAIGRCPRDENTKAITYILDSNFSSVLLSRYRHMFPRYIRDAIKEGEKYKQKL